ncbi:FAD-dependent oxidoreductase [Halalkalibacillus halophilus]|uniref:FAD-dependent oxidoreductase n=1 Tax=Halalkalibacillus halophilus TaxID=392827 RepID=UPI00041937A0|nr:FAD-dependent oxidoreductase [Halalkalibacillus halophilus]
MEAVHITINGEMYEIPAYITVSTAIMYAKGISSYRQTEDEEARAPVCQMGVCFDCTVHIYKKGRVRGCMIDVEEGMHITTSSVMMETGTNVVSEGKAPESSEVEASYDVAIIGAGPAGMGVADELSASHQSVILIDEQKQAGGQIYRQPFEKRGEVNPLVSKVEQHESIDHCYGHAVWSIHAYTETDQITSDPEQYAYFRLFMENYQTILARRVVLATGAYDRLIPMKGWTLPGVMSAGGIQVSLKTQMYLPGLSVFLAGSHPFLFVVAKMLVDAGVEVKGIAVAPSYKDLIKLSKHGSVMVKHRSKLHELFGALRTLHKNHVPIWFDTVPQEIIGEGKVEVVKIRPGNKSSNQQKTIACDLVGMCYGFTPVLDLAKQLGCRLERTSHGSRHVVVDSYQQTSVKGVYAVGELTKVGGAERSEADGRLLGGRWSQTEGANKKRQLHLKEKEKRKWDRFAGVLTDLELVAWKKDELTTFNDAQIVCRCENISVKDIKETMNKDASPNELNTIKLETRCGMGLCQGKYCEESLYRLTKEILGKAPKDTYFKGQSPVKAITIRNL